MIVDVSRDNPTRPPDWRWQRAMGIVDGTQPLPGRRFDGADGYNWIKRAVNFKSAMLDAGSDQLAIRRLASQTPDIFWAYRIWDSDRQLMRWDIEAQILARSNDCEIGFACGIAEEVVLAFEALFWNVREKLVHQRYILHCVMGEAVQRGLSDREYDLLWKLYGYFYGPHMLWTLTSKMVNPNWCASADTASSTLQDDAISTLKLKSALAAKLVPVNGTTQIDLLNTFTKFIEVERTTDTIGKAQGQILDHIQAMMVQMPIDIGGRDPYSAEMRPHTPLSHYRQTAVELSFPEMMSLAAGHVLPNGPALELLDFPSSELAAGGPNENAE